MSAPDINEVDLNTPIEFDSSADPNQFFTIPLLDDQEWDAVLELGDRKITVERQRDKNTKQKTGLAYLAVHLHAVTIDTGGNKGLGAFDNPTSIVMQSQGLSKLHSILLLCGAEIPNPCSLAQLKEIAETTFAQSPKVKITTRWEAQAKDSKGDYVTLKTGQRNFPPVLDDAGNPTGKYNPEVTDPKTGLTGSARVQIVKYARA